MSSVFKLDHFTITNTRSKHKDTVYVAFTTLVTPRGQPVTQTKSMGDLNNGTFSVGLTSSVISLEKDQTLVLNYFIVNAGKDSRVDIETALERVGRAFASGGIGVPQAPNLMSAMGSQDVLDWFALELQGIYAQGSCDGLVAVEQDTYSYVALLPTPNPVPYALTTVHNGTEPPGGCNKHVSGYSVTYTAVEV
jgi:hypothetical protein